MYEVLIIGGGPAGVSAGIYAARKKMKAALVADSFGGQSVVSDEIDNWIGVKSISGAELAKRLEEHLRAQEDIDIFEDKVVSVLKTEGGFLAKTLSEKSYEAKTVLVCSGSGRRRLNVLGEEKFIGRGVAFCSTCDAPFFKNKEVAVVGAGNAGLEASLDLDAYASRIYLMVKGDKMKGDEKTREEVLRREKVEIIYNAEVTEIFGDNMVSGLKYRNAKTGEEKEISLKGVFVEIGIIPNSGIVKDLVETNENGEIKTDARTGKTSREGIWAAGDVADLPYKQNNISAGEGIRALLNIYEYLRGEE